MLIVGSAALGGCKQQTGEEGLPSKEGSVQEVYYSPEKTKFSLWAPTAEQVTLRLFDEGLGGGAVRTVPMKSRRDGSWTAVLRGDMKGKFYTFRVCVDGEWLDETAGIFALATGPNGQRGAVVDLDETDPEGWAEDKAPALASFADIMIYEVHHRDFSVSDNSGVEHKGKFLAMTEEGTVNAAGLATGIDHLKELGVTHVHLLPSFDYASVDETRPEDKVYNWGYDPVNYNVPDGSYSTDPAVPEARIREFKEMVMALHKAGIRVVLDVVYNHLFDAAGSCFERTVPGYYFRFREDGSYADASGCGNETASDAEMMRRYMVESVCYWVNEYHIDGFRFDLMGIHDIKTMNEIRAALDAIDPTIFVYGEGWAASSPQLPFEELAMKANVLSMPGIAAFSDEMRDALRGPFNDNKLSAFLNGKPGMKESIKFGIVGGVWHPEVNNASVNYSSAPWTLEPAQMISYVSCHDDMCLRDRLFESIPGISEKDALALDKLAQTAVFTSQGVPFIYAGEEVFRTKQGVHNSYNAPDSINAIDWSFKTKYADLYDYYKGLIALRKAHPALRLGSADAVRENLHFLDTEKENVLAYRVSTPDGSDELIVVLNSGRRSADVEIPAGEYVVLCDKGVIDLDGIRTLGGSTARVAARSALILCAVR